MSNFVIIRHSGIKSRSGLISALRHNTRAMDVPNADPAGKIRCSGTLADALAKFDANMESVNEKPKAGDDTNIVLEYFITASPEMMKDPNFKKMDYFRDAHQFMLELLGEDNFLHAALHLDETSPHVHFFFTPIKKTAERVEKKNVIVGKNKETGEVIRDYIYINRPAGARLCASDWTDQKASARLQTNFAEQVGERYGLRRGIKKSKATHKDIKTFYGDLANESAKLEKENERLTSRNIELEFQKKEIINDTIALAENISRAVLELEIAAVKPTPEGAIERAKAAIKNVFNRLSTKIPELAESIQKILEPAVRQVDESVKIRPTLSEFLMKTARGVGPRKGG